MSKLNQNKNSVKILLTILLLIILAAGIFFVSRSLFTKNNIAETETSASNSEDKVKYTPGEIIVSFTSIPSQDTDRKLREIAQLPDLKLKKRLTQTTYLYESIMLRDNALVGINSNNISNGKWGNMDEGSNRTLTILNDKGKTEIENFEFAEPNYIVEAFTQ